MVRLIGKNKSVLKSAGSVSAGNKSVNNLLALFEGLATAGSITGVWNMNELYNSVLNSDWIADQTATTARAQAGGTMTLNSVNFHRHLHLLSPAIPMMDMPVLKSI